MFSKTIEKQFPHSLVRIMVLVIALLNPSYVFSADKEVSIYSRAKLNSFPEGQYVEFLGGSQTFKRKKWSYLAFIDNAGKEIEVGPSFKDITYNVVTQFENRYLWAFGAYNIQGSKSWVFAVISIDYGKSWKVVELKRVFKQASKYYGSSISFSDIVKVEFITPKNGVMEILTDETNKPIVLFTKNGGFNWKVKK